MLSDEEKRAIKRMKEVKDKNVHTFVDELSIILNLIEKQSKEIEELKEKCKEVVCIPEGTCFMFEPKDVDKKWEDKIKARIEEYEKMKEATKMDTTYYGEKRRSVIESVIAEFQSLLEKE